MGTCFGSFAIWTDLRGFDQALAGFFERLMALPLDLPSSSEFWFIFQNSDKVGIAYNVL